MAFNKTDLNETNGFRQYKWNTRGPETLPTVFSGVFRPNQWQTQWATPRLLDYPWRIDTGHVHTECLFCSHDRLHVVSFLQLCFSKKNWESAVDLLVFAACSLFFVRRIDPLSAVRSVSILAQSIRLSALATNIFESIWRGIQQTHISELRWIYWNSLQS
jgi:hypothetical protein